MIEHRSSPKHSGGRSAVAGSVRHPASTGSGAGRPTGAVGVAALQRTAGNAAVAALLGGRRPAPEVVVQRAPYLANADDLIYGDSDDPKSELAYLGKLWSTDCFVPYSAVRNLRDWYVARQLEAAGLITKSPKFIKGSAGNKGIVKPPRGTAKAKKAKAEAKTKVKRGGGGVIGQDETFALTSVLKDIERDPAALAALTARVKALYVVDRGSVVAEKLDAKRAMVLARKILESGPQEMRTGGGSRLPSPVGKVCTSGPMPKDQLLGALGVPEDERAAYDHVTVEALTPDAYLDAFQAASGTGANLFQSQDRLTGIWFFYASTVEPRRSSNSRIQVAGTAYMADADFLGIDPLSAKGQRITASYNGLAPPTADSGWLRGSTLTRADRGEGQAAAMDKWNALGAAAYGNRFLGKAYDLNQNWEWLHIQGAQIGGQTEQGNLVAGLYVTNSAMIPFENMIVQWAKSGPMSFHASFRAVGTVGPFATGIELWIKATGHPSLGDFPERRLASFDPLSGRLVDKMAGEIVKRQIDEYVRV